MADTTGAGNINLPALQLIAGIIPATTGDGDITLPLLTLEASGGGVILPALTLSATGLSGTVTAPSPLTSEIVLPSLTLSATGIAVTAGQGNITLPALTLAAYDGNRGAITLPRFTLAATGLSGNVGHANITLPSLTLAATGHTSTSGNAAITLPQFTLAATGLIGTTGALREQLLRFTLAARGVSGTLGAARITLPMLTLDATGHTSTSGQADIVLPMLRLNASSESIPTPATVLSALVLETEATRLTTYSQFAFNSLAEFNGVALGANENGLFILSGNNDDEAAITSTVRFGVNGFKEARLKRPLNVYVGYRAEGEMTLTVSFDEDDEYQYTLLPRKAQGIHPARVKLGRGAKGRYVQLALQNRDGADFELDQMELVQDLLSRRLG